MTGTIKKHLFCLSILSLVLIGTAGSARCATITDGTLVTSDDITIAFTHYADPRPEVVVIVHGFYNNKDTLLFSSLAERFAEHYDVISFDLRGHGESSGFFSWTSFEERDLRAVIDYATGYGYEKIGVIGFSLGAAVSIIEGSINPAIDGVIAVSPPADFWQIDYHFWEKEMLADFLLNLGEKGKGKMIRPGNPFMDKTPPINVIEKIAPRPILLIHGEKDWLIDPHHSRDLFDRAKEPKEIALIAEAGHAEKIFDARPREFMALCLNWFKKMFTDQLCAST